MSLLKFILSLRHLCSPTDTGSAERTRSPESLPRHMPPVVIRASRSVGSTLPSLLPSVRVPMDSSACMRMQAPPLLETHTDDPVSGRVEVEKAVIRHMRESRWRLPSFGSNEDRRLFHRIHCCRSVRTGLWLGGRDPGSRSRREDASGVHSAGG